MKYGFVYTFRWKERKNIGMNWANKGRTTSKIADVYIDEPRLIESPSDLDLYVSGSGFKTRKKWLDVIMSMNNQFNQMHGYLYKVMVRTKGRSPTKCCYMDIEKICIHPSKEHDTPLLCNPNECDYYFEAEWYFTEITQDSQQVRIHGGKVEDIKDPKLKAILSKGEKMP